MIKFAVFGKVPSKSNSYKVIKIAGHGSLGKTATLKEYEKKFFAQVPAGYRGKMIDEPFRIEIAVYWERLAQDLDNAAKVILDCLQISKVIKNDNLCYEIKMSKHLDAAHPRCEIKIEECFQQKDEELFEEPENNEIKLQF